MQILDIVVLLPADNQPDTDYNKSYRDKESEKISEGYIEKIKGAEKQHKSNEYEDDAEYDFLFAH